MWLLHVLSWGLMCGTFLKDFFSEQSEHSRHTLDQSVYVCEFIVIGFSRPQLDDVLCSRCKPFSYYCLEKLKGHVLPSRNPRARPDISVNYPTRFRDPLDGRTRIALTVYRRMRKVLEVRT
jgi:hypothetical protein